MARPYLSVIIPAYNEAERLPLTLIDIDRHLSSAEYSYEILVVSDGSIDNTADIVRRMSRAIKNLKLVDNDLNQGKGAAVRQGMLIAQGKIRLFTDADNSTSVDQFNKMVPYFSGEHGGRYHLVIGSRAIKGSRLEPPQTIFRRILGRTGALITQLTTVPGIWDTQCGFKAFTDEAAERVFGLVRIAGWGFDIEILALAKALGYRIKEVPVVWVNSPLSRVRPSTYLKVFCENFTIRWWLWRDTYHLKS